MNDMKTQIRLGARLYGAYGVNADGALQLKWLACIMIALSAFYAMPSRAATAFTLNEVMDIAMQHNPTLGIARAQQDAAEAAVTTAKAFINPEVEAGSGPSRYRTSGQTDGKNWGVGVSQPLEFWNVRRARREIAESNVQVAGVGSELTKIDLRSRVKNAFYDVLHRQSVLRLAEGNRNLLQQIRERVKLRVDVGESPRYELIKADTEALAAERDYQAAFVRVTEAKAYLRGLLGPTVPMEYDLKGELPLANTLPSLESLRERIDQSPELEQIRAAKDAAEAKLRLEESLRFPGVTLKAGFEQDPDMNSVRLGVAVPLPLWNRRQGQIAEAAAGVRQMQAVLSDRELALNRDVESAYQRYLIAGRQVASFEKGLLNQAESTLKVAEDAYRYGERGILEYLDAQRTFSMVRKDYLAARFDYVSTMLEIERLLGAELLEVTP